MKRTELGKFGLFFIFLITADSTICPPHSTTRLGEDTAASWYDFMFLRPHARICMQTHTHNILRDMTRVPLDKLYDNCALPPQQWAGPQVGCLVEPYRGSQLSLGEPEEDLTHLPTEKVECLRLLWSNLVCKIRTSCYLYKKYSCLVLEDEFSSHQCLSCFLTILNDGMPH